MRTRSQNQLKLQRTAGADALQVSLWYAANFNNGRFLLTEITEPAEDGLKLVTSHSSVGGMFRARGSEVGTLLIFLAVKTC